MFDKLPLHQLLLVPIGSDENEDGYGRRYGSGDTSSQYA